MTKTVEDALSELESQKLKLDSYEISVISDALKVVMRENHHASNAFVDARRVFAALGAETNRLRKLSALKELI